MNYTKLSAQIQQIVRSCGQIILHAERTEDMVSSKEGHANFVTTYDKKVQETLKQKLLEILPDAAFIGEEDDAPADSNMSAGSPAPAGSSVPAGSPAPAGSSVPAGSPAPAVSGSPTEHAAETASGYPLQGYTYIVDPIDGTTNFIKDYKVSAISVCLSHNGEPVLGIVYNPYLDELFHAEKGMGAYVNDTPIHVSQTPLERALILFGTSPYNEALAEKSFELAYSYFKKAADIRRSGSSALDLCNVAAGRAELFFELQLQPWDFAAGALIVEEAGGIVTAADGSAYHIGHAGSILAASSRIYKELKTVDILTSDKITI